MTVNHEFLPRGSSNAPMSATCLEDRFEVLKDIGDGSFGSVALARVRTAGAHIARRGTLVAIKTMKKTFESFAPCLELREVIFLRSLPNHAHLVPALDIFLDPMTKKLHICMEHMDGNLYQLMKARDHKCLDGSSVKSILFQILSGLEHIHAHHFFHRDIKPENILVSTSAPLESSTSFRRYSALVTPPSTPPLYTIKIADFGLARETHSHHPYTTYVSTRWYRAPEVLLRAGEYSAPVDIWAIGAMAVEIANLKPLFPGGNEVDQVWRVCEIMGSPGNWYDKSGGRVGGGDWRDGIRLAQKLGFSFPKVRFGIYAEVISTELFQMAPHSIETILRPPQWPAALSSFVTWCLMWDPRNRPTSAQAMKHEYFADAIDPLRPRSSTSRFLSRKQFNAENKPLRDSSDVPQLTSKPSWFRKSLVGKDNANGPAAPVHDTDTTGQLASPRPSPVHANTVAEPATMTKPRPFASKRATWTHTTTPATGAPMPILPSIRPISPFSNTVTAQAANIRPTESVQSHAATVGDQKTSKKIGRQLSVASHGNHYADYHRHEAERVLNGNREITSPGGTQKEGFFSHLRKRARRISGRPQAPMSPSASDIEANAGCGPWQSNRASMNMDPGVTTEPITRIEMNPGELEKALQSSGHPAESSPYSSVPPSHKSNHGYAATGLQPVPQRHPSASKPRTVEGNAAIIGAASSARTRRALQQPTNPTQMYETPDEQDELVHEALHSTSKMAKGTDGWNGAGDSQRIAMAQKDVNRQPIPCSTNSPIPANPYPTPSPSAKRTGPQYSEKVLTEPATPFDITRTRPKEDIAPRWPTPPYEENEWAAAAAASIFAAGSIYQ
ncbi:MAG: hypothetical protein Q9193_001568 [Seirophora villosa]